MGTRYLTAVYLDGEYKVAQYGQQDGYPRIGGAKALAFARNIVGQEDRNAFKEKVRQCRWMTAEELGSIRCAGKDDPSVPVEEMYPELSDRTGADILTLVQSSESGLALLDDLEFAADSLFCEWAWVIDLDKGTFECYQGSNAEIPLTERDRFYFLRDMEEHGYFGIRLAHAWELSNLPDDRTFLETLETPQKEKSKDDIVQFIVQRLRKKQNRGESR